MPDCDLIRRILAADDQAASDLFYRYHGRLVHRAGRWTRDEQHARDLAQETWARMLAALETYDMNAPLWPWMRTILDNAARNAFRDGETREGGWGLVFLEENMLEEQAAEIPADAVEVSWILRDALADLPARQRQALTAVAIDGESHAVAALRLGLKENALRQLLHRGRTRLRISLEGLLGLAPVVWFRDMSYWSREKFAPAAAGASLGMQTLVQITLVTALAVPAAAQASHSASSERTRAIVGSVVATDDGTARDATVPTKAAPSARMSSSVRPQQTRDGEQSADVGRLAPVPEVAVPGTKRRISQRPNPAPEYRYGVEVDMPAGDPVAVDQAVSDERESEQVDAAACATVARLPGGYCESVQS